MKRGSRRRGLLPPARGLPLRGRRRHSGLCCADAPAWQQAHPAPRPAESSIGLKRPRSFLAGGGWSAKKGVAIISVPPPLCSYNAGIIGHRRMRGGDAPPYPPAGPGTWPRRGAGRARSASAGGRAPSTPGPPPASASRSVVWCGLETAAAAGREKPAAAPSLGRGKKKGALRPLSFLPVFLSPGSLHPKRDQAPIPRARLLAPRHSHVNKGRIGPQFPAWKTPQAQHQGLERLDELPRLRPDIRR